MDHSPKEKNKLFIQSDSFENLIDKILFDGINISGLNHLVVCKNINTINKTLIDYLAIDKYGNLTAIIKTIDSNNAFENNLDITLWLDNLSIQTIKIFCEDLYKLNFDKVFEEKFNTSLTNINNSGNNILLITNLLDQKIEIFLDNMINKYKIPVNALILENVKEENEEYILQSWYSDINSGNFNDIYKLNQVIPSWNNSYLLDIPVIDKQHKMFFKIYDDLIENNTQTITDEYKYNAIELLEEYVIGHFQTEEILIKRANYSETEQHINEHKLFINKVNEFKLSFQYKNTQLVNQMLVFIRKWFLSHISNSDAQYKNVVIEYIKNLRY